MGLALTQVVMAKSFEEARDRLDAAMTANGKTMQLLGIVLRKTY